MAESIVFDTSIPCCISGGLFEQYGSEDYYGPNLHGGWEAPLSILRYLDTLVPPEITPLGQGLLTLGAAEDHWRGNYPQFLGDRLGYSFRNPTDEAQAKAVFDEMADGTYWPRLIYIPGAWGDGWDWGGVRDVFIRNIPLLKVWLREKRCGLYASYDDDYYAKDWVPELYDGSLTYRSFPSSGSLKPSGVALTSPLLSTLVGDQDSSTPTIDSWAYNVAAPYSMHKRVKLDHAVIVRTATDEYYPTSWPVTILGMPPDPGPQSSLIEPTSDPRRFAR